MFLHLHVVQSNCSIGSLKSMVVVVFLWEEYPSWHVFQWSTSSNSRKNLWDPMAGACCMFFAISRYTVYMWPEHLIWHHSLRKNKIKHSQISIVGWFQYVSIIEWYFPFGISDNTRQLSGAGCWSQVCTATMHFATRGAFGPLGFFKWLWHVFFHWKACWKFHFYPKKAENNWKTQAVVVVPQFPKVTSSVNMSSSTRSLNCRHLPCRWPRSTPWSFCQSVLFVKLPGRIQVPWLPCTESYFAGGILMKIRYMIWIDLVLWC